MKLISHRPPIIASVFFGVNALIGCAAEVVRHPVPLAPQVSAMSAGQKVVKRDVRVTLDTGFERLIKSGSAWRLVGTIPQGQVFRSDSSAFTVEGAHVHEAYLVANDGELIGFYLPVEKSFSALNPTNTVRLWEDQR